jgi:hypothetical protein
MSTGARHTARDRAADVACVVVAASIAFLVFMPTPGPGSLGLPDAPPLVNVIAGALSWVSLWWRRRWPVPLAVALLLGAVLVPTVVGAAAIALFTVAVHRRAAVTAAVTALAVVAGLVQHRLHPIDPAVPVTYWVASGVHALVCLLAATWGVTVRARRQLVLSLAERTRRAGTAVTVRDERTAADAVPGVVGRTAFRVAQEGLTNARKHAPGAPVTVALAGGPGTGLTVGIRNRLAATAPGREVPGSGTGLIGLAERAALAGGRLEHGPTADGEYRLWAWLPWPA